MDEAEERYWHRTNKKMAEQQLDLLQRFSQAMRRGDAPDASFRGHVDTSLQVAYVNKWLSHVDANPLFDWHAAAVDWFHDGTVSDRLSTIVLRTRHILIEITCEAGRRATPPKNVESWLTLEEIVSRGVVTVALKTIQNHLASPKHTTATPERNTAARPHLYLLSSFIEWFATEFPGETVCLASLAPVDT